MSEERMEDEAGSSEVPDLDDSLELDLDELLQSANRFIDSFNDTVDLPFFGFPPTMRSPTTRSPTMRSPTTRSPTMRSPTMRAPITVSPSILLLSTSSSSQTPISPPGAAAVGGNITPSTPPRPPNTSPVRPRRRLTRSTSPDVEFESEVNRIQRFCETLERNLSSLEPDLNSSMDSVHSLSRISPRPFGAAATNAGTMDEPSVVANVEDSYIYPPERLSPARAANHEARDTSDVHRISIRHRNINRNLRNRTPEAYIDLSMIPTPAPLPRINRLSLFDDDDDDVILVSASIPDVVDLDLDEPPFNIPRRARNSNRNRNGGQRRERRNDDEIHQLELQLNQIQNDVLGRSRSASPLGRIFRIDTPVSSDSPQRRRQSAQTTSENISPARGGDADTCATESSTASSSEKRFICPVCMENALNKKPTSTQCGHLFCADCIHKAVRMTKKCPMCNKKVGPRQMVRIYI